MTVQMETQKDQNSMISQMQKKIFEQLRMKLGQVQKENEMKVQEIEQINNAFETQAQEKAENESKLAE